MTEMDRTEQRSRNGDDEAAALSWGIRGDQRLLVDSARVLRCGIKAGVHCSHPHGECAMFGIARLLDAIAFSLRIGDEVNPAVISGAMEIALYARTYLQPTVCECCSQT